MCISLVLLLGSRTNNFCFLIIITQHKRRITRRIRWGCCTVHCRIWSTLNCIIQRRGGNKNNSKCSSNSMPFFEAKLNSIEQTVKPIYYYQKRYIECTDWLTHGGMLNNIHGVWFFAYYAWMVFVRPEIGNKASSAQNVRFVCLLYYT